MRWGIIILVGLVLAGCSQPNSTVKHPSQYKPQPVHCYRPAPAGALAFSPPVALYQPPLEVWRDLREPAAIVGVDEVSVTFFDIRMSDRQTNDFTDRFERHAVSQKVGVSYR